MKSFCVKTNNKLILENLLKKLEVSEMDDIQHSNRKFKIYSNVIIHYTGETNYIFYEFISEILVDIVLKFYQEKIMFLLHSLLYQYCQLLCL